MITAIMFFKENTNLYFEKAPQAKKTPILLLQYDFHKIRMDAVRP